MYQHELLVHLLKNLPPHMQTASRLVRIFNERHKTNQGKDELVQSFYNCDESWQGYRAFDRLIEMCDRAEIHGFRLKNNSGEICEAFCHMQSNNEKKSALLYLAGQEKAEQEKHSEQSR